MRVPRPFWPLVAGVVVGAVVRLLGLQVADAVLAGLVAVVLATVWLSLTGGEADPWPPDRRDDTAGARSELSALTWAFIGRDGRVSEAAVRRLRELAAQRLADQGVTADHLRPYAVDAPPDDERDAARERARAALGERAWAALTTRGGYMPSLADVAHCVDVVERLRPGARAGSPARPARPTRPTEGPTP